MASTPAVAKNVVNEPLFQAEDQVDLLADELIYEQDNEIVSAVGDVELVQSGRILRADKISYHIAKDKIYASGNVVLNEVSGDVVFANQVELQDQMKNGFVKGIRAVMADGSRFWAERGDRVGGVKVVMRKATYTACSACESEPDKMPLWRIKADKVVHNSDEQRISYSDARFEVLGVPVFYTPYFTHPDGSVKRKSGFLALSLGYTSSLGALYQQDYYWALDNHKDATLGVIVTSQEAPVLLGEYRHRFADAEMKLEAGTTYSDRVDNRSGEDVLVDEEFRGHLAFEGRWDINEKWRAGSELFAVTDDQYFRQYDLNNEDVLENQIYLERFSDRNYALGRLFRFQDLRIKELQEDQPNILPEVYANFVGKPNALLGGRWSAYGSALGLQREGNEQDVTRVSFGGDWQKRYIAPAGLVTQLDIGTRGDLYEVKDVSPTSDTVLNDPDITEARGFLSSHLQASYPLKKDFTKMQMVVEPKVALTAVTDVKNEDLSINEDSEDVVIDALTLFNANHFPGYDRVEDRSHITYGLGSGLYGYNGYNVHAFMGQIYRIDEEENPFVVGSGLAEQESDFVGQISSNLGGALDFDYRFQLANDNLSSRRHEVDASGAIGRFDLAGRYFYAAAFADNEFDEAREQVWSSIKYRFYGDWYARGSMQYDLSESTEGLRRGTYGIDYLGQCVDLSFTGERRLTRESSGDSDTTFKFRVGLKNLGG